MGAKGFTLIEILVVVVILGILATIIVPRVMGRPEEARIIKAKVDIKAIETALSLYKIDNGSYPTTELGLRALVEKPIQGVKHWREGGYLPKIPGDPWGAPYVYLSPGAHGEYDLFSLGADGEQGGEGKNTDISNWDPE
jgi:general secretion pathway protein G